MDTIILQPTDDPAQSFYIPASPDGSAFQARVDLRYLTAPDLWILSISDAISAQVYVNQIPVICSYEELNDLRRIFAPGHEQRSRSELVESVDV